MFSLATRQLLRHAALPMLSHSPIAPSSSPAAAIVTVFSVATSTIASTNARRFATAAPKNSTLDSIESLNAEKKQLEAEKKKLEAELEAGVSEALELAIRADITAIRQQVTGIDARITAVDNNIAKSAGARILEFSLKPGVREQLARPLSEWKAGDTFDVTGLRAESKIMMWQDVLYLRAEALEVLREWESGQPYLAAFGSAGIGKSAMLQIAALRALVRGDPVLVQVRGVNTLMRMVDESRLSAENVALEEWRSDLPRDKDIVFCYDSPNGFQVTVGHATFYKAVLIVHSPSGDLNNTLKSDRMSSRYVANPLESELIEVAALNGISADDARERIYRYGPSIRFVCNPSAAEDVACLGVRAMIAGGVKGLSNLLRASREVHAILLMVPEGPGSEDANLAFPSEYIRDQVIRGLATNRNDVVDLLRFINSVYGNMRGEALKSRMLDLLGSAGNKIRFKTKDANGDGVVKALQIAGVGVVLRKAGMVLSLPKGGTLQQRVLYRPPYSNNTAWDALIVEDDTTAYLLQMTVSLSHPPIKREGLVAGAKFLTAHGFKGTVHLVFLTTPYVLRWLKLPQSVTETDAVTAEQQWPQHAWCVDKVNDLDYWSGASTLANNQESI